MRHLFSSEATRATTQNAVATREPESVFRAGALRVQSRACSNKDFVGGQSRQSGRTRGARRGSQTPPVVTAPTELWQEPDSREQTGISAAEAA